MAFAPLVSFTEGYDISTAQEVGSGETHTLVPIKHGRGGGKVAVSLITSEGRRQFLKLLGSSDDQWQLSGPATYVVEVRNAGCDVDTGA